LTAATVFPHPISRWRRPSPGLNEEIGKIQAAIAPGNRSLMAAPAGRADPIGCRLIADYAKRLLPVAADAAP
jgi:hypothetical protein